jgi:molybdopterin molybdotransferase
MALLPVKTALEKLLAGVDTLGGETVSLHEAAGRVLVEPVSALRTQPPFTASAMDGYAVRAADTATPPARLSLIGEAPAGHGFAGKVGEREAVRIFTGAPVPEGADAILIQENAKPEGDGFVIAHESVARGRFVRPAGLDFRAGEILLEAGHILDPAALSLAAAANHPDLQVVSRPVVAIIATGDELLPPGSDPGPDQIIASNSYGVAALAADAGARVEDLGIVADNDEAIAAAVGRAMALGADILVTLGGASVGDHDLVRQVLGNEGMELDFWKIAMRPGKPLMVGRLGQTRVLGLPGNPVSSIVCAHLFLKPLIAKMCGRAFEFPIREAVLGHAMPANDEREDYVRAKLKHEGDLFRAHPFSRQDSSMLKTLAASDCLIIRDSHAPAAGTGQPCRVLMLK